MGFPHGPRGSGGSFDHVLPYFWECLAFPFLWLNTLSHTVFKIFMKIHQKVGSKKWGPIWPPEVCGWVWPPYGMHLIHCSWYDWKTKTYLRCGLEIGIHPYVLSMYYVMYYTISVTTCLGHQFWPNRNLLTEGVSSKPVSILMYKYPITF